LLALSDPVGHFGLEHHESSENRLPERSFIDPDLALTTASLLPHEMVHSWNGKHRRPVRLTSPDDHEPVHGEMLWIYEGLTTYLGRILPARSGLWSPEEFRDHLAVVAADAEHFKGRGWRSLADAGVSAQQLYNAGSAWSFRRWSADASFYDTGELLWLEVDTTLRDLSDGAKGLDDFCHVFFGGEGGKPSVRFYELRDVIEALDGVAHHDWARFFADRVNTPSPQAPLGGLERAGWKLTYDNPPTPMFNAIEKSGKWGFDEPTVNLTYSLGFLLKEDGNILDVVPGMAADRAGVSPGTRVIAVNGRRYSATLIRDAVRDRKGPGGTIDLLIEDGDFFMTHAIEARGGARHPRLVRIEDRPDRLEAILKPRAGQ
jgi:predicted metalloprotease with PDZ domain